MEYSDRCIELGIETRKPAARAGAHLREHRCERAGRVLLRSIQQVNGRIQFHTYVVRE
jgi:hypothetical protein